MSGRGRVALMKGVAGLLEIVPEGIEQRVATRVATTVGRLSDAPRRNLRANLQPVLEGDDEALLERFVDRGFENYGRYWAEGAKLPVLAESERTARFAFSEGEHHLRDAAASGRGVIVALPHVGSWEWGGSFLASVGLPMTAVAEALEPPELFAWFADKRRKIGINIEPLDDHAGTALLSVLRDGGIVGLLCDRDIQNNGVPVTFFGRSVTMPAGPATLALRTGAVLLAAACYAGPGDQHHAVITAPIPAERTGRLRDDVVRVTQLVAHELEGLIRRAPEQWHVLQPVLDRNV
jgi:phosphatidylinositol dimannoside acyltransferase